MVKVHAAAKMIGIPLHDAASKQRRLFFLVGLFVMIFGSGLAAATQFKAIEGATATVIGAMVGFLAGTLFKYGFDRVRDAHLEEAERRAVAAALMAELQAIETRCHAHNDWLVNKYRAWASAKIQKLGSKKGKGEKALIRLPEIYPIYDAKVFDAVRGKIGMFDVNAVIAIVRAYDAVFTSERRADRYVDLTYEEAVSLLPQALNELQALRAHARIAIPYLADIAGIPSPTWAEDASALSTRETIALAMSAESMTSGSGNITFSMSTPNSPPLKIRPFKPSR